MGRRNLIVSRFKLYTVVIFLSAVFILIYSAILMKNKSSSYPTANKGRVLTNSARLSLEEAFDSGKLDDSLKLPYSCIVVDLKGQILLSSTSEYKKGEKVNLRDFIEYDNKASKEHANLVKYSAPLVTSKGQAGTAIFFIPKSEYLDGRSSMMNLVEIIPIAAASLIIIILSIHMYHFSKRDILAPIAALHESAKRILKGDFTYGVNYDDDTEIGAFCHDFEAMRDEIKFSKEKEAEIKVNEKELLASLSHDIKTPLTAINGYVSGIKDGIVKDRAGIDNYCDVILKRLKLLTKLLDDILEHSKAELNKLNIVFTEFYTREFFKDIIEDISIEVESKGFKFIYPENIPNVIVNADKKRLSEVIYNLVSNSIKYSKEQGEIAVYFEILKDYLYVYVKDSGIGIPSKDVPYIFNRFYRGEKSRNQNIPGSGLGLSISKYIVEAHGGFISCIESSSKGTTMCFTLPTC